MFSLKQKKILPAVYALLFSAGLIVFGIWYIFFFKAENLFKTTKGVPQNFGLKQFNMLVDTGRPDLSYKIELKNQKKVFVVRMYGEDFNVNELEKNLASGKSVEIIYHPMQNEHKEFEVYQISQDKKIIYTFNKNFSTTASKSIGWIMLVTGGVIFLLGIFSVVRRLQDV